MATAENNKKKQGTRRDFTNFPRGAGGQRYAQTRTRIKLTRIAVARSELISRTPSLENSAVRDAAESGKQRVIFPHDTFLLSAMLNAAPSGDTDGLPSVVWHVRTGRSRSTPQARNTSTGRLYPRKSASARAFRTSDRNQKNNDLNLLTFSRNILDFFSSC